MASQPSLHHPLPLHHELTRVKRGGQRVVAQGDGMRVAALAIFSNKRLFDFVICGI
jgi:hypothetical protein